MRCVTDSCNQGRESCPTPATCFGAQNLHRVMHIPLKREEADAPVSTPEQFFDWIALAWTLTLASVVAVVVTVVLNWPLFLAAVK